MLDSHSREVADAIGVEIQDGRIVITIAGDIDWSNALALNQAFDAATAADPMPVVFDIADVEFLDSSFLRSVVLCQQRLAGDGVVVSVRNPRPQARKVFEVTGMEGLLE